MCMCLNEASWSSLQRSVAVWPHRAVQSCVTGFCLRPYNHSIAHTQHRGDEAVIPGVATHKQACNPQNYTNLLWNWLNLQIRFGLQHQPDGANSSERTKMYTVHRNRQKVGRLWMHWRFIRSAGSMNEQGCVCLCVGLSKINFIVKSLAYKPVQNLETRAGSHHTIITLL